MKNIQIVLNTILSKNVFEYIIINRSLAVEQISLGVMQFLNSIPSEGSDIRDYLPELVGFEEDISSVFNDKSASIELSTVQKNNYYFNIYVDHYDEKRALVLLQNITEISKAQQKALQYSNQTILLYETLQKIIDSQNTLTIVTDNRTNIEFVNKKLLDYIGAKSKDDEVMKNFKLYDMAEADLENYTALFNYLQKNDATIAVGEDIFIMEAVPIDSVHFLFTLAKATEIIRKKQRLEKDIVTDQLTGTYRKHYFESKLDELIDKNTKFALVVVDIDNFKNINDKYGHTVGDKVLQEFANILKGSLKENEVIARWGGEEFLMIICSDTFENAFDRTEDMRIKIASHSFSHIGHMTASFGITWQKRGRHGNAEGLLHLADKALYRAKNSGKNRVMS